MFYTNIITGEKEQILTTKKLTKYELMKSAIRNTAIKWQAELYNKNYSYGEYLYYQNLFRKYGKKYGLIKEFEEEGIC